MCAPRLRRILSQPFPKNRIEGFVLGADDKPGLLDEACVRSKCDVFHTISVYTVSVPPSTDFKLLGHAAVRSLKRPIHDMMGIT